MKWVLSFVLLSTLATPVLAEEFNAGIVQGLWYSQETLFAEQPVRIYVAIRNNTGSDLTGTVEFYHGDTRIDRVSVSALDGRIIERWTDWIPTHGEHTISATLTRTKLHTVGESSETIEVTAALSEDTVFVDYDTDEDGIGNKNDLDDDGDGVSDIDEKTNGTDPLQYDEPPTPESKVESPKESESESSIDTNNGSNSEVSVNSSTSGLEQYLTPSRADTVLSSVTQLVTNSKEKLDNYRHSRAVQNGTADPIVEEVDVNENGFGEITRTTDSKNKSKSVKEKPKAQKPNGFLGDIFTFVGTILNGIYTGILTVLSFALGHPIFIQLFILFAILFGLYKTAQKMSRRPQ